MDIDIDFPNRDAALAVLPHINASRIDNDKLVPHNTGVYFQEIPHDAVNNLATIDYKNAESRGYFKVDFLNLSLYNGVLDEAHLDRLMNQEPIWELLQQSEFSDLLFQLNGHGSILKHNPPTDVFQLAAVLAMIRPAKRYLIGKDWNTIMSEVWTIPTTGEYYWKKSHAFAYAMVIVVQMNLICEQLSYGYS